MRTALDGGARFGAGALALSCLVLATGCSARRGSKPTPASQASQPATPTEATEPAPPMQASVPPLLSCEETIPLRHADAAEVATTLNRILESAHRKSIGTDCVLLEPIERWLGVSARPQLTFLPPDWKPVEFVELSDADRELLGLPPAGVCEECYGGAPGWNRFVVDRGQRPWPTTLRAIDGRTLAVLHARGDDEFFARIREYVAELDVAPVAD